ncbi:MAG: hypothetical protein V4484_01780 [Pseudomonadota bacterium]
MMTRLLLGVALWMAVLGAQAAHGADDVRLAAANKTRLVRLLDEALRDAHITKAQYAQSRSWIDATPCNGVERSLGARRQFQLEAVIAKEQKREKVHIYESFSSDGWLVLYTDASDGDSPYLFYATDPIKGARPVTRWSGGATIFDTSEVAQWVQKNAPGIPARVANCFAWHVTLGSQ